MENKYNDINIKNVVTNATNSYNSGLLRARESAIKYSINIIVIIILVLITGLIDVTGEFSWASIWAKLISAEYWIQTGTRIVILSVALQSGINMFMDKTIDTDPALKKQQEIYIRKLRLKENDFGTWLIGIYNTTLKREAYIAYIDKKITRLDHHSKFNDKVLYSSVDKSNDDKKLRNRYCIRKNKLMQLKSDAYISEHLEYIKIKFTEVPVSDFESNITGNVALKKIDRVTHGNPGKTKAMRNVKGIGYMFLWSTLFGILGMETITLGDVVILNIILKLIGDMYLIINQIRLGISYTDTVVFKDYTMPLVVRNEILDEYVEWESTQEKSKTKTIMDKINAAAEKNINEQNDIDITLVPKI